MWYLLKIHLTQMKKILSIPCSPVLVPCIWVSALGAVLATIGTPCFSASWSLMTMRPSSRLPRSYASVFLLSLGPNACFQHVTFPTLSQLSSTLEQVSDVAIGRENIQKHAVFITFCFEFEVSGSTPSSLVFCLYFPVPNSSSSCSPCLSSPYLH